MSADLDRSLLNRPEALTAWLGIPGGRRRGKVWSCGAPGGRIDVTLTGPNAGCWGAWSAGARGRGLVGLIAWKRGISYGEAIVEAHAFLGDTAPTNDRWIEPEDDAPAASPDSGRTIERARRIARRLRPLYGTPGERYLIGTRRIPRPAGGWPASLGFDPVDRALAAVVTDDAGDVVAVHRIFLTPDGRKIDAGEVEARRLVALKRTDGPKSLGSLILGTADAGKLLIAEGVETGLAAHVSTGLDVVVVLGPISHCHALPAGRDLILLVEDDMPDRPAAKTTAARIARWAEEGHQLALAWPWPERRGDKSDLADVIAQHGPEAVAARIAAAEAVRPLPGASRSLLPAYYPGPTEPRETAIGRQAATIMDTVAEGVRVAVLRRRMRARRAELLDGIAEPTAVEKAAATRQASQEIVGGPLPKPGRVLVTGSQGTGKTSSAIAAVAAIREAVTVWISEPRLDKAVEVAADYRKVAGPDSLPIRVVRGRSAADPLHDGATMCERPQAAAAVAGAGLSVRKALCATCPASARCGYLRQQREIAAMPAGAVFVLTVPYLFLPSPAPVADVLIADEDAVMPAVEVTRMDLADLDPFAISDIGIDTRDTLNTIRAALARSPNALDVIRAAGIDQAEIKAVRGALTRRLDALLPSFDGATPDADIVAALDQPERRRIQATLALLAAMRREIAEPRASFNAIQCRREEVIISRLRRPHGVKKAAVLALDGTGDPDLAREVFGKRLIHHRITVERQAHVTGTRGKSYSRQSITGLDRKGNPRSGKLVTEAEQLRADIAAVASQLPATPLIVANKAAIGALALPEDAPQAHFGALRGLNTWERTRAAVIVGRESVAIEQLEALGRAFLAHDPVPVIPAAGFVKQTRMRRMRGGLLSPVEAEVHPDPRMQRVMEQVREAEVLQAVDRLRPVWHRREYALLNQLCLDLTYDVIRSHGELVAGGNPIERTYLATGVLPLGGRDLHCAAPELFPTERAAARALAKYSPAPNRSPIWAGGVFCYRRHGQRGRGSRALVDLTRHADPRAALSRCLRVPLTFQGHAGTSQHPAPAPAGHRPDAMASGSGAIGSWSTTGPHARPMTHAPPRD